MGGWLEKDEFIVLITAVELLKLLTLHLLFLNFSSNPETCARISNYLLDRGISANSINLDKYSCMHLAVNLKEDEALKYAVGNRNFDANLPGKKGCSPLHLAVIHKNANAV